MWYRAHSPAWHTTQHASSGMYHNMVGGLQGTPAAPTPHTVPSTVPFSSNSATRAALTPHNEAHRAPNSLLHLTSPRKMAFNREVRSLTFPSPKRHAAAAPAPTPPARQRTPSTAPSLAVEPTQVFATPAASIDSQDVSGNVRRSSRSRVAPLAYWSGERKPKTSLFDLQPTVTVPVATAAAERSLAEPSSALPAVPTASTLFADCPSPTSAVFADESVTDVGAAPSSSAAQRAKRSSASAADHTDLSADTPAGAAKRRRSRKSLHASPAPANGRAAHALPPQSTHAAAQQAQSSSRDARRATTAAHSPVALAGGTKMQAFASGSPAHAEAATAANLLAEPQPAMSTQATPKPRGSKRKSARRSKGAEQAAAAEAVVAAAAPPVATASTQTAAPQRKRQKARSLGCCEVAAKPPNATVPAPNMAAQSPAARPAAAAAAAPPAAVALQSSASIATRQAKRSTQPAARPQQAAKRVAASAPAESHPSSVPASMLGSTAAGRPRRVTAAAAALRIQGKLAPAGPLQGGSQSTVLHGLAAAVSEVHAQSGAVAGASGRGGAQGLPVGSVCRPDATALEDTTVVTSKRTPASAANASARSKSAASARGRTRKGGSRSAGRTQSADPTTSQQHAVPTSGKGAVKAQARQKQNLPAASAQVDSPAAPECSVASPAATIDTLQTKSGAAGRTRHQRQLARSAGLEPQQAQPSRQDDGPAPNEQHTEAARLEEIAEPELSTPRHDAAPESPSQLPLRLQRQLASAIKGSPFECSPHRPSSAQRTPSHSSPEPTRSHSRKRKRGAPPDAAHVTAGKMTCAAARRSASEGAAAPPDASTAPSGSRPKSRLRSKQRSQKRMRPDSDATEPSNAAQDADPAPDFDEPPAWDISDQAQLAHPGNDAQVSGWAEEAWQGKSVTTGAPIVRYPCCTPWDPIQAKAAILERGRQLGTIRQEVVDTFPTRQPVHKAASVVASAAPGADASMPQGGGAVHDDANIASTSKCDAPASSVAASGTGAALQLGGPKNGRFVPAALPSGIVQRVRSASHKAGGKVHEGHQQSELGPPGDGWSAEQLQQLQSAIDAVDLRAKNYWCLVAQRIEGAQATCPKP